MMPIPLLYHTATARILPAGATLQAMWCPNTKVPAEGRKSAGLGRGHRFSGVEARRYGPWTEIASRRRRVS